MTSVKKAEQDLMESFKSFENLADKSPVGIVISEGKQILFLNKKLPQILKTTRKRILSKGTSLLPFPSNDQRIDEAYRQGFRTEEGEELTLLIHHSETTWQNKPVLISFYGDITAQARIDELLEVNNYLTRFQPTDYDLDEFLENVVREIYKINWVDACGIYKKTRDDGLYIKTSLGLGQEFYSKNKYLPPDDHRVKFVMEHKSYFGTFEGFDSERLKTFEGEDLTYLIVIPLVINREVAGCFNIGSTRIKSLFGKEKQLLESIATNVAVQIFRFESHEALIKSQAELERKVVDRTIELVNVNKKFQEEINFHKATRAELSKSEKQLRNLQNNIPIGIFSVSEKGKIISSNPALLAMFGFQKVDEFQEFSWSYYFTDQNERKHIIRQLIHNGSIINYELKMKKADGSLIWVSVNARTDYSKNGKVKSFDGTVENITDRVIANQKFLKTYHKYVDMNRNLEKRVRSELKKREQQRELLIQKSKLESLGRLAAGMAHEINQPLGIISLALENLQYSIKDNNISEAYINKKFDSLFGNIDKIKQIIEHVRIFSRGQQSVVFDKINVNKVIEKALSLISAQYKNHNIHIIKDLSKHEGFTVGNFYKLEQVILNLLSNSKDAVDAKFKGFRINRKKTIRIRTFVSEKSIFLEIEDNGIGMEQKIMGEIFNPFFTTKSESKGTGLGLSIVYGIVKEMKGEIKVESEKDEYTRFTITLPFYREA